MNKGEPELRPPDIASNSEPRRNGQNNKHAPISKFRSAIAFFTIEPLLFCYILCDSLSNTAVQELYLDKACRVDLGNTKDDCYNDNITIAVRTMFIDINKWHIPLTNAVPVTILMFIGAWSDLTGNRKALILIPMVGELVSSFGLVLTTHYFEEWPLFITVLIKTLPTTFSGGFSVALMGSYSYLADVTSLESRTFRIGIAALLIQLGKPAAYSIRDVLLDAIGYYGIFGLTTTFYLFGLIYTYLRIRDVNPINVEGTWYWKLIKFFNPNNAWDTLRIVFKRGPNRMKIILVIAAHMVLQGPDAGQSDVLGHYIQNAYNMDVAEIILFYRYQYLIGSVCGTAIAMVLFCKYLKLHDAILGLISTTGNVLSSVVCAFAPSKLWFYSGSLCDIFNEAGFVAIRSSATKVAAPQQVAKMCALLGMVDKITPMIYKPIFLKMYIATLKVLPGAFSLLGAALTAPAFFIFTAYYMIYKKEARDEVHNPERRERYAHENYVTEF